MRRRIWEFWQPDLQWINQCNMTNLRSLNAIRGFIFTGIIFGIAYLASVSVALRSIWICKPGEKELSCSGSLIAAREALAFAEGVFNSWALLVTAMAGIALGGAITKRVTDHTYVREKAKGKAEGKAQVNDAPPKEEEQSP